jgi:hypothetical protein
MEFHLILLILHIVGTVLGVGGATMIEIHLNKALRDGKMDTVERDFLGSDFFITRVGMTIGLVTGLGFVAEYATHNQLFRLENGVFWAKMIIFLIIVINAYLLQKHRISLYWGSAFSFTSWWIVMLLGMFLSNSYSIIPSNALLSTILILGVYGVVVIISAYLLHQIRELLKRRFEARQAATPPTVTP